ncbi:hypothetical protein [Roseibium sp.]|uniref:hypothetical protein n=1 Tax=Roseibium sp. TaxID=1936156 RepID=UPI003A96E335
MSKEGLMRAPNVFWPVFKQLEERAVQLTRDIHVCDDQLFVYSSVIADVIIRAVIEIEAITKQLYQREFGGAGAEKENSENTDHKRFDDLLKKICGKWCLDEKVVFISHYNCFQSEKVLLPFKKNVSKTGGQKQTYSWNNAYQDLKHDRSKYLPSGNLRNMFSALSAAYLLNLYFRDEVIDLKKDSLASSLNPAMGSSMFSIEIATDRGFKGDGTANVADNYRSAAVYVTSTENTRLAAAAVLQKAQNAANAKLQEKILTDPTVLEILSSGDGDVDPLQALRIQSMREEFNSVGDEIKKTQNALEYEARINKNQLV